jgi:hypothetical protein
MFHIMSEILMDLQFVFNSMDYMTSVKKFVIIYSFSLDSYWKYSTTVAMLTESRPHMWATLDKTEQNVGLRVCRQLYLLLSLF